MREKIPSCFKWYFLLLCFLINGFVALSQVSTRADSSAASVLPSGASHEIRGTITDSSGALVGVSVQVKNNPNIGTSSDVNGKYILNVPDNATLVFTMVGYETQEMPVRGKEVLNVYFRKTTTTMNDVVVVAFGKQKKSEVVGSVTSITPSELKVPSSNLTTALAGRLAGVIAYQRSGEPGQDNAEFFIRGVTTFGYKTDPLILIDQIEYTTTELARLNPDDIASFSIMKDATATALYGARGANGVILITTKEGKQGKAKISVRIENSLSAPTRNIKLADPITYMRLHNEAVLTRDPLGVLPYSQAKIDNTISGVNPLMFPTTDWRSQLFRSSTLNQRANFNVSGGGQVARYYLAGTINQDNGILKVDKRNNFNSNIDLKTFVLRSNVNINVTKTTEIVVRFHGSFDDYQGPIDGGTGMYNKVMRSNPVLFPAYYPANEQHRYTKHILFGNAETGGYLNPYADMVRGYKDYSRSLMLAQVEWKQDLNSLAKGLTFHSLMNTNRQAYFDVSRAYNPFYYRADNYDKINNTFKLNVINPDQGTDYLGYSEGTKTVVSTFFLQSQLNYARTFGKHGISGLGVFMARSQLEGNAADLQRSLPYRNVGVSGRGTYSYDNRFFGEFNFGYNGSERFFKRERYGFFPSAGAAWFISNEDWFDNRFRPYINKLKLRGTYGLVGNDAIGDANDRFFYLSNVNMSDAANSAAFGYDGGYSRTGISIQRYENPFITWETATKANLALEVGLFNKFEIIAEVYREHRYNILMNRNIPATLGLQGSNPPRANVGKANGQGLDLSIDYNNQVSKRLFISARGNFTYATSKFEVYEEPKYDEQYLSRVGYPIRQTWGYIAERLFVDDEEVKNSPTQVFGNTATRGGDIKYRDVNGDGQITVLDRVPIGHPTVPEIVYGFGLSVKYSGFDVSSFFQGSARSSFWINPVATAPFVDVDGNNSSRSSNQLLQAYANDYWSEQNRNLYAMWPRLSPALHSNNTQTSTWFMRNGAFLRLKQFEMGYTLPTKALKRFGVASTRIYANGTNLINFSSFKTWDIEMGGNGLAYPIQRVINVGAMVSF